MTENNRKNNNSRQDRDDTLRALKKKILLRAFFSVVTLLLTAVLIFSLTAAWYTNVADAGGLTFVAKEWDFDGNIIIQNDAIAMSPGDSGTIFMQISNNGTETASAAVTVSKANLSEPMKQRLYFYVDTTFYRNAERMDRVYVSDSGGYTYTVFPNSQVSITEDSQNAPPLKWMWVYDVLGYYVRGSVTDMSAQIDEYLRPIEYAYDPITTTFATDGALKTVDGFKTVGSFLKEISETDGYEGTIDVTKKTANGYYPVYVNSEGYGVWAYICNYDEIMQNMQYDTKIGEAEVSESYPVEIYVTGSNTQSTAMEVSSKEMLASVLSTMSYANVKLTQNMSLDQALVIKGGSRIDIDLNGYTLSSSADNVINAEVGSKITVSNGILSGNGQNYGVLSNGAEIVLSNTVMQNVSEGIKITDHQNSSNADSRVHIVDSEISAAEDALWIYGNNGDTETKTMVIIERSKLTGSAYAGILCNGSYKGTDIQVLESTVKGYHAGIYHPQKDSTLKVLNSEIEGLSGIVVKGGTVTVEDSTVRGIGGVDEIDEPAYLNSGFSVTGDGIYLEANYDWTADIKVLGAKTNVTSASALAVRKFEPDAPGANIVIEGGNYSTDVSEYLAKDAVQSANADGSYTVNK